MIRLDAPTPASFCDGLTRRDFLHAGALATLGLTLPGVLAGAEAAGGEGRATSTASCCSCVGGPSHIDTWDPKPNAPAEVRGPFQPIKTNGPGIEISEIFPQMAKHADKFSLIRSRLPHGHRGPRHRPPDDADRPAVHRRRRAPAHRLRRSATSRAAAASCRPTCSCRGRSAGPAATCRTARRPATSARQHDPFVLNADPSAPNFKVPDLLPPDYISAVRAERRQKLRDAVDGALAVVREERRRPSSSTTTSIWPTG